MKKILIPIITVLIIGTIVGLSTLHRTPRATTTTVPLSNNHNRLPKRPLLNSLL